MLRSSSYALNSNLSTGCHQLSVRASVCDQSSPLLYAASEIVELFDSGLFGCWVQGQGLLDGL